MKKVFSELDSVERIFLCNEMFFSMKFLKSQFDSK